MTTEERIPTRLGDGSLLSLTRSEMRADIEGRIRLFMTHFHPLAVKAATR